MTSNFGLKIEENANTLYPAKFNGSLMWILT